MYISKNGVTHNLFTQFDEVEIINRQGYFIMFLTRLLVGELPHQKSYFGRNVAS